MVTKEKERLPKPGWLKVRFPAGDRYSEIKGLLRQHQLHTVCEEAKCPNIGECFNLGEATFMILGDICTRACGFCAVTSGKPIGLDLLEPVVSALAAAHRAGVTSIERVLGQSPGMCLVEDELASAFEAVFDSELEIAPSSIPREAVLAHGH